MIIHCTRKLAAKLPEVSAKALTENSPLGSWHAHVYVIDRRNCLLFCHDETRYTVGRYKILKWCPGEDLNLHDLAATST